MLIIPALLFAALFLILGLPFLGICSLISRKNPKAGDLALLRTVQRVLSIINGICGVRVTVIGEENIPKDEAVLFIANHRSIFDILVTYPHCPGLTGYVSKMSLKKVPVLRLYMEHLHCLFIDRDDLKQSLKVILAAIDQVKNGISVFIFPEGTRNKDHDHPESMGQFKEGSFKIATKSGCRIVPIALVSTDRILETQFPWARPQKVTMVVGTPIDPKSLSREEQKRIGAYVQDVIQQMLNEQLGI